MVTSFLDSSERTQTPGSETRDLLVMALQCKQHVSFPHIFLCPRTHGGNAERQRKTPYTQYVKRPLFQEDDFHKSMDKLEEERQEIARSLENIAIGQVLDPRIQ